MEKKKSSVVVLIPYSEYIPGHFLPSLAQVTKILVENYEVADVLFSAKCPLDAARNLLFGEALTHNYDYVLWIDTDMLISGKQAYELINFLERHPEYTASTGFYFQRGKTFQPLAFIATVNTDTLKHEFHPFVPKDASPVQIDGAGLGCFAINMNSFREKADPQFDEELGWSWDKASTHFFHPFFEFTDISEDLNFCRRLKKADAKLALLPYIEVAHYGMAARGWCYQAHKRASDNFKTIKLIKSDEDAKRVSKH